jgi:CRP/FNR family transcriptional regulator, cyclic AMP receptor protein
MDNLNSFFAKLPLFSTLDPAELGELVNLLGTKVFTANQKILTEGEPPPALYVILTGTASVDKTDSEGGQDHICDLGDGECVGEVEIIDGAPCTASVTATSGVRAAYITRESLDAFFSAAPQAAVKILRRMVTVLAKRLRDSNTSYSSLLSITENM